MKIILSGIPCSGKTHFGNWLRDKQSFTHINLEDQNLYFQNVIAPRLKDGFSCWLSSISRNVVVTWGFPPNASCFEIIDRFTSTGFEPWWFDADRETARKKYMEREGLKNTEEFFDTQVKSIDQSKSKIDELYDENRVTTLSPNGYLPEDQTLARIKR